MASLHKRELLEAWTFRWSNHDTNPSSGFHPANKIPPTLSLMNRFKDSDWKTFSRLIQFCTGHTHLGEYYRRFIRTEDPACPCGHTTQTRRHILNECPKFARHRPLLGTGRYAQLENLIGTEKGIKRLAKFITTTKAIDKHKSTSTNRHNTTTGTEENERGLKVRLKGPRAPTKRRTHETHPQTRTPRGPPPDCSTDPPHV